MNEVENNKIYIKRELDEKKNKLNELNEKTLDLNNHLEVLERDYKHIRNMNIKYENEINDESNGHHIQINKHDNLYSDLEKWKNN